MRVAAPAELRHVPCPASLAGAPVPVLRTPSRRCRKSDRLRAGLAGTFVMPTHPIHGALRRGLLVPNSSEETVRVRAAGPSRRVRVRMGFAPRPAASAAGSGGGEPPAGAGLLKAHLDLVDLAAGPEAAERGVAYDLGEALARLGFVRLAGGGYHPATVREHLRRLAALGDRRIALAGAQPEPVWRFFVPQDTGLRPLLAEDDWELARRAGQLVAMPGTWLAACELNSHRLPVGRELLALPIDGHGHQVERLALLLAAELAVWEREEMRMGPHVVRRGVGTLLARAGVTDLDALRAETAAKGNGPKRLRSYLAGEGFADEGALALLRERAGLDVDIADEAAFWAAGRGWVERFWEARLRVGVRGDEALAADPASEWALTHWLPRAAEPRELGA